jgi:hypothetical protein
MRGGEQITAAGLVQTSPAVAAEDNYWEMRISAGGAGPAAAE